MSLGLDIGSSTIKIVELAKEADSWRLKAAGVVGYNGNSPDKITSDRELADLSEIIKKLKKEAKVSTHEVAIALPETQVFTRAIKFPLLSDSEIASAVRWEAEQHIPIPIKDAVIEHQIIERDENSSPPQAQVLLIATPRIIVERYVKLIQMSGMTVVSVETELLAMSRSLAPKDQTVMIVDFGSHYTNMGVVKNGVLMVSRSITTAGEAFTRAVSQGLGISPQQAEEYKRAYGLSSTQLEGKIRSVLDPVMRVISDEMRKTIHYFQAEHGGDIPRSIILSGGTAGMPEAVSTLTGIMGIEVLVANPFAKVNLDPETARTLSGYAPFYSISVGLAMKN